MRRIREGWELVRGSGKEPKQKTDALKALREEFNMLNEELNMLNGIDAINNRFKKENIDSGKTEEERKRIKFLKEQIDLLKSQEPKLDLLKSREPKQGNELNGWHWIFLSILFVAIMQALGIIEEAETVDSVFLEPNSTSDWVLIVVLIVFLFCVVWALVFSLALSFIYLLPIFAIFYIAWLIFKFLFL